ncbi:hypothetical protein [Nocardia cyriacigeorgica]|uniref:hypothetical protein n=1 Tax=Nocardia cyriacigeorgica TaxID=135487 RepID=UPI0018930466|nr:hypothetical protein [Nocardia cyriacigeorgica]MBF6436105.1 hypothetical protein [Nocardia cyriacigeorgica]MBF6456907.1 hypothetical protein [Nocardia cyriacigeorgica]MBF6477296.1 hypothetical protein [Nocardia cyriacigeorgica]MBF6551712.1 hypothetical protein [Nocardia cyriacigeorgica]
MTISDAHVFAIDPSAEENTTVDEALQRVIFGEHRDLHLRIRDALIELDDRPRPDLRHSQEAELAPGLLRKALPAIGATAVDLASDAQTRGAFCDWAQVLAPRMFLILTGHIDLSTNAIRTLGNGSAYQRQCLAELNTGATVGGLGLTELDGTNGADHQTTATWDPATDGFWLNSPTPGACKYMPNVGDPSTPKTFVITARLFVDGHDEGVLPFLTRLRTADGPADGVRIFRLPDKSSGPMDHALIRFARFWVPRDALLGGSMAQMTPDGRFECRVSKRERFSKVIAILSQGRLDLATAAITSARAGLVGAYHYASQRMSGTGTVMMARDNVGADLMPALAATYATSALGRRIRDMVSADPAGAQNVVFAMLAKPLLSYTAHDVLKVCRWRTASQGILRSNRMVDWIGNLEAIITAEGENQILQVVAASAGSDLAGLELPGTPREMPWYVDVLGRRARAIADGLATGDATAAGAVMGRNSAAIQLTTATAERLAVTALVASADETDDRSAKELILLLAEAYALDRIRHNGLWYTARGILTQERAREIEIRLAECWAELQGEFPTLLSAFQIPAIPGAPLFAPGRDYKQALVDAVAGADPGYFSAG